MPKIWRAGLGVWLVVAPLAVYAQGSGSPPPSTLQQITRDAEERLRQWDAEDQVEDKIRGWEWAISFIDLAVGLALSHGGSIRAARFSSDSGFVLQSQ